jgi:hypothetical protein
MKCADGEFQDLLPHSLERSHHPIRKQLVLLCPVFQIDSNTSDCQAAAS